jgi:hypothetical protein
VIFGASSFAGPLEILKEYVRSIELYIPKLGIYNGSALDIKKLERILDEISIYDFASVLFTLLTLRQTPNILQPSR